MIVSMGCDKAGTPFVTRFEKELALRGIEFKYCLTDRRMAVIIPMRLLPSGKAFLRVKAISVYLFAVRALV